MSGITALINSNVQLSVVNALKPGKGSYQPAEFSVLTGYATQSPRVSGDAATEGLADFIATYVPDNQKLLDDLTAVSMLSGQILGQDFDTPFYDINAQYSSYTQPYGKGKTMVDTIV